MAFGTSMILRRTAKSVWDIVEQTVTRFSNNEGVTLAAATSYYAAFSFFPLIYVLIIGLGFALQLSESAQDAEQQLLSILAERTVPAFTVEVQRLLEGVKLGARGSVWWAPLILLFGAIGIFSQMEFAFDRLWHNPAARSHGIRAAIVNALWNRLKAFLTLVALGVLLIVVFVADLVFSGIHAWTDQLPAGTSIWDLTQLGFTVFLNTIVMMLLYRLMPRRSVRWVHAFWGGLIFAVVWQIGSQLLSRHILGGTYSAYGVVGSFIAVMLWVYCACVLLYLGGQFVQVLGNPDNSTPPVAPRKSSPPAVERSPVT
jgi:membrane protein